MSPAAGSGSSWGSREHRPQGPGASVHLDISLWKLLTTREACPWSFRVIIWVWSGDLNMRSHTEGSSKYFNANKVGHHRPWNISPVGTGAFFVDFLAIWSLPHCPLRAVLGVPESACCSAAAPVCGPRVTLCPPPTQGLHECEGAEGGAAAQQHALPQCLLRQLRAGRPSWGCHLALGQGRCQPSG